MSLSETFQISSISIPGSQLQCYWVQGIRESHDLTINLARDVSRDGAAAAICNYEYNRLGHCIQIIWNIYKLSWTRPLSVASPVQYQEYEYDKGNIWVLIADVKIVMWTENKQSTCFDQEDRRARIVNGMSSLFLFHVQSSYSVLCLYSSSF